MHAASSKFCSLTVEVSLLFGQPRLLVLYRVAANVFNYTRTRAENPGLVFAPAAAALLTSSGCCDPQGMARSPPCSPQKCAAAETGLAEADSDADIYRGSGRE